jgi:hypothetical protein
MSGTLYLFRQQLDYISPSLFLGSDREQDFVELGEFSQALTYDNLVEKIFSSAHVIVI